jgi:hypothetical protein
MGRRASSKGSGDRWCDSRWKILSSSREADGKMTWNGHVELKGGTGRPRKHVNMAEEKLANNGRETDCVRDDIEHPCHKKQEQEKGCETDCPWKKIRASRKNEEIKRHMEMGMTHKKKYP